MFKVKNKATGEVRTVYGFNGSWFIFYNGSAWEYDAMCAYEPVEV